MLRNLEELAETAILSSIYDRLHFLLWLFQLILNLLEGYRAHLPNIILIWVDVVSFNNHGLLWGYLTESQRPFNNR